MARPKGFRLNRSAFEDILNLRGVTQTESAERSGLSEQMVSALVHGGGASIKTVHRLAGALGCDAATLFPELTGFERKDIVDDDEAEVVAS